MKKATEIASVRTRYKIEKYFTLVEETLFIFYESELGWNS